MFSPYDYDELLMKEVGLHLGNSSYRGSSSLMASPSGLTCLRCGTDYPADEIVTGCTRCRSEGFAVNLRPTYSASAFRSVQDARGFDPEERGVWRYHALLPASLSHAIWLGEGETPLVHAGALGA